MINFINNVQTVYREMRRILLIICSWLYSFIMIAGPRLDKYDRRDLYGSGSSDSGGVIIVVIILIVLLIVVMRAGNKDKN